MNINIKTQLRTILIDKKQKQSETNTYQSPQIITLPVTEIIIQYYHTDNSQTIIFNLNENIEVYYTLDGSNPKNSTTVKKIKFNDSSQSMDVNFIHITNKTIVKYYTKNYRLNIATGIYIYKPVKNTYEHVTINMLNTTPIYSKGAVNTKNEQTFKIQINKYGFLIVYKNNKEYDKYVFSGDNFTINKTDTLLIKKEDEAIIKEYTLENGLRTRMNYTYTMKIPYQTMKLTINSKTIIDLNSKTTLNKLKNGSCYLYNYKTKTITITKNKNLNEPGTIIYLEDNDKNITIKTYNYTYGDVNQVSIVKEWTKYKTIKISTINNCNKNEICTVYLPSLNYIDCYFISNDFYKANYDRDYLNPNKINNQRTLESVQTYILSNNEITSNTIIEWIDKKDSYDKSVYKSCYGTFLTGLTDMYLNNAIRTVLRYKLNLTEFIEKNIQIRVSLDVKGHTAIDIDEKSFEAENYGNNETNKKIYYFLSGLYGSYIEGLVLQLGGDKNAISAMTCFGEDLFNGKSLNFTYDNKTGDMCIHTQGSNDYYIKFNSNGSYSYIISKMVSSDKKLPNKVASQNSTNNTNNTIIDELHGGHGTENYGYKYENSATDNIFSFIYEFSNSVMINYVENFWPKDDNEAMWTMINSGEDLAGCVLISAGVATYALSAPVSIPVTAIVIGAGLCFVATGVNEWSDLNNPYFYCAAAPSIISSLIPEASGVKLVKEVSKMTTIEKVSTSFKYARIRYNISNDLIDEFVIDQSLDYVDSTMYTAFLNSCGLHET